MKVIFVHHSCFVVEMEDVVLIFDYFEGNRVTGYTFTGVLPVFDKDKSIYFFASHKHQDHFDMNILKLAEEDLQITLALSLHAPNDEVRKTLMPVANKYKLVDILAACHQYFVKTGRRLTFEYSLVSGVNDNLDEARALVNLIKDQQAHVNLIPVNPIKERNYVQSNQKAIQEFKGYLEKHGINVTVRREMGRDIGGACGQLRKSYMDQKKED